MNYTKQKTHLTIGFLFWWIFSSDVEKTVLGTVFSPKSLRAENEQSLAKFEAARRVVSDKKRNNFWNSSGTLCVSSFLECPGHLPKISLLETSQFEKADALFRLLRRTAFGSSRPVGKYPPIKKHPNRVLFYWRPCPDSNRGRFA